MRETPRCRREASVTLRLSSLVYTGIFASSSSYDFLACLVRGGSCLGMCVCDGVHFLKDQDL